MKLELAPSILSCDLGEARRVVSELIQSGADWIHFDVMDGQFVPPITFGADFIKNLTPSPHTSFEAHLMTQTPERHFDAFIEAGCTRIIFHAEATQHSDRLAESLRKRGILPGIAINPGTPVEMVEPLLEIVDLVLIMTVNPGWGGQQFISRCLSKVQRVRRLAKKLNSKLNIQVDGGIDPQNLLFAADAGANVFVVGSYLNRSPELSEGMWDMKRAIADVGYIKPTAT